ncbi:hypothetical protein ABGB12_03150 [Actinocorallia sp. B10E7]|uniref:hypothetical protein n=1 Tax=Actinocorallia sp. B10E7 TaxID=3153558 RepID=UPI00325EA53A
MATTEEKKARLKEIEEDIAGLLREFPDRTDDPQDYGDAGAALAQREELSTQLEVLAIERDRLKRELGLD